MIYSIVTMLIKKGKMDDFLAECRKIRPLVLAEPGCLMYDYTREIDTGDSIQETLNADRITLYEKWASQEALDIHNDAPYMTDFVARVRPLRESVTIRTGVAAV
jgi:quinol monooxygenase YgiN